ncbi:vacuolar protein sorting-associated protein 8 [Mytilus galloprovincialis]|uniref:Vacuolar protein sorting-associated protein 8 n=1 Tax=Mytilus galloprovincialis TaxID=29158 RepID=A0A8B6H4P7_MYTGA|nr:vacuolar protein sorting-associated protein 8 [Mytilus galloprovincialis]
MAVADDEKRSDVLEDANKIEVSFEPSEFGSSSPLTKVADPGSPGKNLNTCTVSLTTLEPGFPRRPVQSTSAGITHSCVGTQEYEHVVSKSRRSSVVAEHEHYRSAVKSLHSTFSITSDKNYLKSSPDDRCSDENVFNAAELPEDTLNEILNDMSDIGQDEEMRTEDDIKELEKDRIENAPQEMGTLTSTGEDETEILNDMADIGQDEEMKTEDDINGLEKYGTKNAPQEKGTSTRTGGDEILNDMSDIGQDEEMRTEDDIKELEKDRIENATQEKATSTSTGGDETEIPNDTADIAQDEEMKTEDGIKDLKKDTTENATQEKGTSTCTGGDEPEIPNDKTDNAEAEEVKTEDGRKDLEKDRTENMPQEVTSTGEDESEILNGKTDNAEAEEVKSEDGIKDLEKDGTENMPQEVTSTGEDEPEIPNDKTDNAEAEEVKTEDGRKDLEKDRTENMPQEVTSTGEDEILNDMADIGQDEEEKTVGDIKDLEKDRTENIPQEKGTSTGEKGSSSDPVNKFASVEKVALESLKMMMKMPMKMLIFFLMIKNLIPSISKKIISQCKYHSISMIREDKFLDGLDTVLNKLSNVICQNAAEIKCTGLQKIQLQYNLLNITWMNPRTLVAMDTKEKIHVIDVRSEEELEVIDVSEVMLVYNTSHFKSLATGGNVSQALAFAGEKACYQTIVSHNGQLFILGTKTVHLYTLRSWRERIDVLAKQNKYQDALALALSFYEGNAKAVVGLTGSSAKRKQIVADLMLDMLFDYVDLSMTTLCPEKGKMEELEEYYMTIVPVCVDHCLYLNRTDILFGRIYERFSEDMIAMGTFLECLEPYILGDKLMSIPPSVMKDFVDHYQSREMLESVEACIVHLEVTSLDIHQVW